MMGALASKQEFLGLKPDAQQFRCTSQDIFTSFILCKALLVHIEASAAAPRNK